MRHPIKVTAAGAILLLLAGLGAFFFLRGRGVRSFTSHMHQVAAVTKPHAGNSTVATGAILGGNYRIVGQLGRGGMGIVHDAFDEALQRRVAIKELRQDDETTPEDRQRFLNEARLAAKLEHPRLAKIYSIIQEATGEIYLVFEHLEGKTLNSLISLNGRLPLPVARRLLGDIGAAVEYAHDQKIIHRDLKPANVMVLADGSCRVMDFGIAHQSSTLSGATRTATVAGTPPYMAPEQVMGSISKATDLYAMGVMTYEMLTGELPFPSPDYHEQKIRHAFRPANSINPALPAALDKFFAAALQADPTKRLPDMTAFLAAFDRASLPPTTVRTP